MLAQARRYIILAEKAGRVVVEMMRTWKFIRNYPVWVSDTYKRCKLIAIKKGVRIPKTKINMEVEND